MSSIDCAPIRIAIVGVGKIARDQHLPAIAADKRFELVAAATRSGPVEGIPTYHDIDALLATGPAIDAVSICTPPLGRVDIAARALAAGIDVMVEKPPAATLSEAASLEARAAESGSVLFATWHSRHAAGVASARAWLADRHIERVAITWREDIRRWHPGQDWILDAGGFGVFDPAINALSIATAILPQPLIVESASMTVPDGRQSPLSAEVEMRCGSAPAHASLDFLQTGPQSWDIVIDTDGGQLTLRDGGRTLVVDGREQSGEDAEYPSLYNHFAGLVEARTSDFDTTPLRLVADAFLIASRHTGPAFDW